MKSISMFVLAFCMTFAQRSQGYTDADIQTLQKLVALTTAKLEDLTRQNARQEKTIQDLTSRFAEFSQKYAELSQQKDQLAFERNVFSSTAPFPSRWGGLGRGGSPKTRPRPGARAPCLSGPPPGRRTASAK